MTTQSSLSGFMKFPVFTEHGNPPCSEMDPEVYFPELGQGFTPEIAMAKQICRTCPYQDPCLAWALENNEFGIWGGTTAHERRRLRKKPIKLGRRPK